MASPSPLRFLLLLLAIASIVNAQTAPAPAPSPLNLTDTLVRGGQYTILLRLLSSTQVGSQIVTQANSSTQGLTLLAPTDNAFQNLKAGILNGLSPEQQVALILYHVLPQFYTLQDFQTISNPVRTQASGNGGGIYTLNFTTSANQVNVSSGLVETQINNALRSTRPLAVYQLDKVLLPLDLFGAKPPASSPPASPKSPGSNRSPPTAAASPAEGNPGGSPNNGGNRGLSSRWSLAAVFGFALASVLV